MIRVRESFRQVSAMSKDFILFTVLSFLRSYQDLKIATCHGTQ